MQHKHHAIRSVAGGPPVYRQVYRRIRSEILSGRLAAGARLPSSRTLASELGVARGTVVAAFQMLAGEGYIVSAGARGTVVNVTLLRSDKSKPSAEPAESGGRLRRSGTTPSPRLLFRVGLPALDAFPRKQWTRVAARVARQLDGEQMANPNLLDVMGYEPLRRAVASYLRIARDITCSADQILITPGFQGALGLIIQTLLKPGAKVWVEDPGYFHARNLLRQAPLRLVGVRVDGGLSVSAAIRNASDAALALVTPSHQFPLGMTLPIERRLALLDWADRQRAWIVEDDYDCEFHHRGPPPPALKSLDRSGRVLYAGSFSKVLFPGLRLGYLVLPGAIAERFARMASAVFPTPPIVIQKSLEAFMSQGHFARHLSRMRTLYTERRKALAAAMESSMRQYVEIRLQDGGMHFVARLRGGISDTEIVERLSRQGIGPAPLSRCAFRASGHNGLMIGYTNVAKEHTASATRRLLAAIQGRR